MPLLPPPPEGPLARQFAFYAETCLDNLNEVEVTLNRCSFMSGALAMVKMMSTTGDDPIQRNVLADELEAFGKWIKAWRLE